MYISTKGGEPGTWLTHLLYYVCDYQVQPREARRKHCGIDTILPRVGFNRSKSDSNRAALRAQPVGMVGVTQKCFATGDGYFENEAIDPHNPRVDEARLRSQQVSGRRSTDPSCAR